MNADQQPDQLTQEERHIYSRLTRRGFMGATAAATLGSLVGREPVRLARRRARMARPGDRGRARPPTRSSCCGWPAAWPAPRRSTRSAIRRSHRAWRSRTSSARFRRSTRRSTTSSSRRGSSTSPGDGPGHGHPLVHGRGSRLHPALAPPVSLAHRLRPAAADGDAAHRGGDLAKTLGPEEPGHAGVHRHRPDGRGRRRDRAR